MKHSHLETASPYNLAVYDEISENLTNRVHDILKLDDISGSK